MAAIPLENGAFADIDKPKTVELPQAVDMVKKYGDKSPEVKKMVWEKTQKLRKNYPNLSDEAFYNLIGGEKFKNTFQQPEDISSDAANPKSQEAPQSIFPETAKTAQNPNPFEKIHQPENLKTGTQFIEELKQVGDLDHSEKAREKMQQKILEEIDAGHIPSFCRKENFHPVTLESSDNTKVTFRTSADYLSIGTDNDYVRVPITPLLAIKLREKYGWEMPTAKMTDEIYDQAGKKVHANPLVYNKDDTEHMQSSEYIDKNSHLTDMQLTSQEKTQIAKGKLLIAGHKKDIIISRYAIEHPNVMDFRGFYTETGQPIQTNPAHNPSYSDYAQGFRLIAPEITIVNPDGTSQSMDYYQALRDPKISKILNGPEGQIDPRQAYRGNYYNRAFQEGGYLS